MESLQIAGDRLVLPEHRIGNGSIYHSSLQHRVPHKRLAVQDLRRRCNHHVTAGGIGSRTGDLALYYGPQSGLDTVHSHDGDTPCCFGGTDRHEVVMRHNHIGYGVVTQVR